MEHPMSEASVHIQANKGLYINPDSHSRAKLGPGDVYVPMVHSRGRNKASFIYYMLTQALCTK